MSDDGSNEEREEEYEVEAITGRKQVKGELFYYVKWLGYSKEDSTWEPAAHLNCSDKIHEFEEEQLAQENMAKRDRKERQEQSERERGKEAVRTLKSDPHLSAHRRHFDSGVEPHTFTGIIRIDNVMHAIVKYRKVDDVEMVPVEQLKKKWPQHLVRFLEKKLVYDQDGGAEQGEDDELASGEEAEGSEDEEKEIEQSDPVEAAQKEDGESESSGVENHAPRPGPSGHNKNDRKRQRQEVEPDSESSDE